MLLHIPPVCPSAFEVPSLVMGVQYDIRVLLRNANDVGYRDVGTSKNPRRANSEPPTLKHPSIGANRQIILTGFLAFLSQSQASLKSAQLYSFSDRFLPNSLSVVTAVPIYKPSRAADNIRLYWMSTSQLTLVFNPPPGIDTPTRYKAVYSLQYDNGTYAPELVSDEVIAPVTEGITINGLEFNR